MGWPTLVFLISALAYCRDSTGYSCSLNGGLGDSLGQNMTIRDTPVTAARGWRPKAQCLVSANGIFQLGFFSPSSGYSNNRYIGIWYNKNLIGKSAVVWIANRETPVRDGNGSLTIDLDGHLIIQDRQGTHTMLSSAPSSSSARLTLRNSGNLVLTDQENKVLWQSFDHPSDTYLPGMQLGVSKLGESIKVLTSWRDDGDDPSPGAFRLGLNPNDGPSGSHLYIRKGMDPMYWISGVWNGQVFSWIPETGNYNFRFSSDDNGSYFSYSPSDASIWSRLVLDASGKLNLFSWSKKEQDWSLLWQQPKGFCDVYARCGPNSFCSNDDKRHCACLRGFQPSSSREWRSNLWSAGCKRQIPLGYGAGDEFQRLQNMRLPAPSEGFRVFDLGDKDCRNMCQKSGSCKAYSFVSGNGSSRCYQWSGNDDLLFGIEKNSASGQDLYIRLSHFAEPDRRKPQLWIMAPVLVPSILVVGATICYLKRKALAKHISRRGLRHKAKRETREEASFFNFLDVPPLGGKNGIDLHVFNFATISAATNNFSLANKLGEGGFGPVYKGNLLKGQQIAVKRLSGRSSQGLDEFRNEILLLARLQHINLVRILGYCIEGEEKILVYEYTPNKSLDCILFDVAKKKLLDWGKRVQIINGIIQGLLYLHKYSRLRIIHRDLKASNVLLDSEMNPKISDFGLARIFGHDESEINTDRIVGTFGYMSPEYAVGGLYSEKSDVFSFGVLLLEIISGKKNTSFNHFQESMNLLGYAWELWKNGRSMDLVDPMLLLDPDSSSSHPDPECCGEWAFTKYIHVGLLCVQESARDRPTMSDVAIFLNHQNISEREIPTPTRPAFTFVPLPKALTTTCSVNLLTMSIMEAR